MARASLVLLHHKLHAGGRYGGLYAVRLVADDAVDASGGNDGLCGCDYVQQQRAASDLMQHLGPLTLEPRSFARSHDGNRKSGHLTSYFHDAAIFSRRDAPLRFHVWDMRAALLLTGRRRWNGDVERRYFAQRRERRLGLRFVPYDEGRHFGLVV